MSLESGYILIGFVCGYTLYHITHSQRLHAFLKKLFHK